MTDISLEIGTVSMLTEQSNQFSDPYKNLDNARESRYLKLETRSICLTFLNNISLKLSSFAVQKQFLLLLKLFAMVSSLT